MFRLDSGYIDEEIIETIGLLGCQYLIKGKEYPTLVFQVTDPPILFVTGDEGRETAELFTRLKIWNKVRRFIISGVLKPEKDFLIEVCFSYRKNYQNGKICCDEAPAKYPYKDVYVDFLCLEGSVVYCPGGGFSLLDEVCLHHPLFRIARYIRKIPVNRVPKML